MTKHIEFLDAITGDVIFIDYCDVHTIKKLGEILFIHTRKGVFHLKQDSYTAIHHHSFISGKMSKNVNH